MIYFDHAATTPLSLPAKEKAREVAENIYGNPSSLHGFGALAERELTLARKSIAATLSADISAGRLIFCGSGTEANNLALLGVMRAKPRDRGKSLVISSGEHPSVLEAANRLETEGFSVKRIPSDHGVPDMDKLCAALDENTVLVSFMAANNESGAVNDIGGIVALVRQRCPSAYVHTDATQAYMKQPLSVKRLGVDLLTVSGHKIGAPKGIGALYIAPRVLRERGISPVIYGGGQEYGLRSGTENVIGAAAFGAAAAAKQATLPADIERMRDVRDYLTAALTERPAFSEIRLNLPKTAERSPAIVNFTLPSIKSEVMLHALSARGIYVSSGSACSSHGKHTGGPMAEFGLSAREMDCLIRVSLGPENTKTEADRFLSALAEGLRDLVRMR